MKNKNLFKRIICTYVYSSYTFHLAVLGISYLLLNLSKRIPNISDFYLPVLVVLTGFTIAVALTLRQLNYKEIKNMLHQKVISIFRYKNKISDGQRTIYTLGSSTLNIIILNILCFTSLYKGEYKPLYIILLLVYIVLIFSIINALHKQMKRVSEQQN